MTVLEEIHRMTVDEYVRIVHDFGWQSTELIEGVVYDVSPEFNRHAGTAAAVFRKVDAAFASDETRFSGSVRLDPFSLVEPDLYVVEGAVVLDPDDAVPASAVKLVVEVSVTTQSYDRGPKPIAYAKAGLPEVWLIDPRPDVAEPRSPPRSRRRLVRHRRSLRCRRERKRTRRHRHPEPLTQPRPADRPRELHRSPSSAVSPRRFGEQVVV